MDCKLEVFSDNVSTTVDKMEVICSLATGLDLSQEITDLLFSAKCSLTDCKLLIHVKLLQVKEKLQNQSIDAFDNFIDIADNKEVLHSDDQIVLTANVFKNETKNIKTECESAYACDDINLETKIEVEDNEFGLEEDFELPVVKQNAKR